MSKTVDVLFRPEWDMTLTLNIPSDWDIHGDKAKEYYYDQLNELSKEELINMLFSGLEGGFDITAVEEIK